MQTVIGVLRAWGVECYTRDQWGSPRDADGSYARRVTSHPMPPGAADYHFLHITVTGDTDLPADGKAAARVVESYGLSTPPMVSYQDMVTNEGRYFQGQSYRVKGTHTVNDKDVAGYPYDLNLHGYATAIMQNVQDEVTDVQVDVIARIYAARELLGLVRRGAPILPHRTFAVKACPGDKAVARLDEIRALRDRYVREGLPTKEDDDMPKYTDWSAADKAALAADVADEVLGRTVKVIGAGGKPKSITVRQAVARIANGVIVTRGQGEETLDELGRIQAQLDDLNDGSA